ncbi:MAG TPA: GNAT family N-acetyltransferase [Verrucomicrobiae bacterium]
MLSYSTDAKISLEQFRDVLSRCALGVRRPLSDDACLQGMLDHTDLTATCWDGDKLVGIARSVTDFHYCCYLSDLAVDETYQKQGIGRELIALTQSKLGPRCSLILLSAPAAVSYYPHIGFEHHPQAWLLARDKRVIRRA